MREKGVTLYQWIIMADTPEAIRTIAMSPTVTDTANLVESTKTPPVEIEGAN